MATRVEGPLKCIQRSEVPPGLGCQGVHLVKVMMHHKPKLNVLEVLRARGLLDQTSDDSLERKVALECVGIYAGIDPSAPSMHLGHLCMIVQMRWWQMAGHRCYLLVGGATGRIGDPRETQERPLLATETVREYASALGTQIRHLLPASAEEHEVAIQMRNNDDWFHPMSALDFLRDVGKHFRMGPLLGKEMVRKRIQSEEGLSYTEFSYQLLQAYDFLYLYRHDAVTIQLGGSDQWGNITGGIELIRKLEGGGAYGVTWPLLLRSDGKKFGKSEQGAVWLCPQRMSPYEFYQYFMRMPDVDVAPMLRKMTFMPLEEIERLEQQRCAGELAPFEAQKVLAREVTRFVHGEAGLQAAEELTEQMAPGGTVRLDMATLEQLASSLGRVSISGAEMSRAKLTELLVRAELVVSKAEARRMMHNGGVKLNGTRVEDVERVIEAEDFLSGRLALLTVGKKKRAVLARD